MNAEEAWYKFSAKKEGSILFVVLGKGNWNMMRERMAEVIDEKKWEKIVWLDSYANVKKGTKFDIEKYTNNNLIVKLFNHSIKLMLLFYDRVKFSLNARPYKNCDMVFTCRDFFREHLAAEMTPQEVVLLDSGMNILKSISKDGYVNYNQNSKYHKYRLKLLGYKLFDRKKTSLFTAYSDVLSTKHKIIKIEHSYKKSIMKKKSPGDFVIWINTPFVDQFGVDIKDFAQYMDESFRKIGVENKKIIYVPHPGRESQDNLDYLRKELNVEIDDRLIPVELKIANYSKTPLCCISPTSSSLTNLSQIFSNHIKLYSSWHYEFDNFNSLVLWKNKTISDASSKIEFVYINDTCPLFYVNENYNSVKEWAIKHENFQLNIAN